MRMPAVVLICCVLALTQAIPSLCQDATATTSQTTASATDSPLSTYTVNAGTEDLQSTYLNDWTNNSKKPLQLVPNPNLTGFGKAMCAITAMCSPDDSACKDAASCKTSPCDPGTVCTIKRNLYIIHVVDWKTVVDDAGNCSVAYESSGWYLYKSNKKTGAYESITANKKDNTFTGDIYDADNGTMISISRLALVEASEKEVNAKCVQFEPPVLTDALTVTQSAPAWLAGLETLISGLAGPTSSSATKSYADKLKPKYSFKVQIQIQAFSAKPLSRPYTVADAVTAAGSAGSGPGSCNNMTSQAKCTFSNTFSIEQRGFISFGILIVPHGPKETTYATASDGTVSSSTTTHNAFYAVIDVSPWAGPYPMSRWPYLQGGLPLSGAAFRLPYAGVAQPISFSWVRNNFPFSVFLGRGFMKHENPAGTQSYSGKWMYGVEVPIGSFSKAISQVTGNKKSK